MAGSHRALPRCVVVVAIFVLCCLGKEGNARGNRIVAEDDSEWLDLDHFDGLAPKKTRNQDAMRMQLRQGRAPAAVNEPDDIIREERLQQALKRNDPIDNSQEEESVQVSYQDLDRRTLEQSEEEKETNEETPPKEAKSCNAGISKLPFRGKDSAERLLLREGVISSLPASRCGQPRGKNVILVVGDGMGWEMARAGAIAKQVIVELESLGCNVTTGCPNNTAALEAFNGRYLSAYYTEGKGSGLSFQNLTGFALVTTTAAVIQKPNLGNNSAPPYSMLEGSVAHHENGMAPLALNECGDPIEFDPSDHITAGGNMVLWDDTKGGKYPWERRYRQVKPNTTDGFDPTYILQHATDSAATATCLATGQKVANSMMAVNLYEDEISTIVEDAMRCGKAAGVVSSKPILHATPGTFISHSNHRGHRDQLRRGFREVNPTLAIGTCARRFYPFESDLESMRNGPLSHTWTFFEQKPNVLAKDFYNGIEELDPDKGDHVLACMGGDFSPSKRDDLPYRGVDSSYSNRRCGRGTIVTPNPNISTPIGIKPNSEICDHYTQEEVKQIPHISQSVKATLDFLSKDDDGFFMMYEQGDIDTAAHSNHMDDMLGTLLDIDESVGLIMDWIANNGGWSKNSLYVTADHDHYLTLLPNFPGQLAKLLIAGESHNITPENFSDQNPWNVAIQANRHEDSSKTQTEHLKDFSTWTNRDIVDVGHLWGPVGSGGNGWGSHSTRPVPLYYQGDGGCVNKLKGKGYQVLGRQVQGVPDKIDQAHIHACMMRDLFGYGY